jgi:hypothetical protein
MTKKKKKKKKKKNPYLVQIAVKCLQVPRLRQG